MESPHSSLKCCKNLANVVQKAWAPLPQTIWHGWGISNKFYTVEIHIFKVTLKMTKDQKEKNLCWCYQDLESWLWMTWSIQIHLLFIPQPAKMIGLKEIGSITKVFDNNACLFQTSFVPMLERVENLREMHCLFVTTLKHQNSDFSLLHYCSIMK